MVGRTGVVLERTVLDEFGIEAAFARVTEFLEENAIVVLVNLRTALAKIELEALCSGKHGKKQCGCE